MLIYTVDSSSVRDLKRAMTKEGLSLCKLLSLFPPIFCSDEVVGTGDSTTVAIVSSTGLV